MAYTGGLQGKSPHWRPLLSAISPFIACPPLVPIVNTAHDGDDDKHDVKRILMAWNQYHHHHHHHTHSNKSCGQLSPDMRTYPRPHSLVGPASVSGAQYLVQVIHTPSSL